MSIHTCHAMGCEVAVPPRMFMCKRHWFMLPRSRRDEVWAAYVPGQERRKDPSDQYVQVPMSAVKWLARKEGLIPV